MKIKIIVRNGIFGGTLMFLALAVLFLGSLLLMKRTGDWGYCALLVAIPFVCPAILLVGVPGFNGYSAEDDDPEKTRKRKKEIAWAQIISFIIFIGFLVLALFLFYYTGLYKGFPMLR